MKYGIVVFNVLKDTQTSIIFSLIKFGTKQNVLSNCVVKYPCLLRNVGQCPTDANASTLNP